MEKRKTNQPKNTKILLVVVSFILVLFSGIKIAQAAYFYFSPSDGTYGKNGNFTVGIFVNSGTAINAVQGAINFPTAYLEAIDVKINSHSIVDLWVEKPSFSNAGELGNVRFEGVILNPGFSGAEGKVIDVVFRAKNEGAAELNFTDFAILANDGLGTNVSTLNGKAVFTLLSTLSPSEEEVVQQKDLKAINEKIKNVEQKMDLITQTSTSPVAPEKGILGFWLILPKWVKITTLTFMGITTIIFSLIILSFGLVVLIWLWGYGWRRREKLSHRLKLIPKKIKRFFAEVFGFAEMAEKEMKGDVRYTLHELKKDFKEAEVDESLENTIKNYLLSLKKIIRRFLTKNSSK
jgi:hypothetical protein